MPIQFCCPQGHVLQGDPTQVGQLFQCPVCGVSFLVPPQAGPVAESSFFQGPAVWPTAASMPMFPPPGSMPGVTPPQALSTISNGPLPAGPTQAGSFVPQAVQPFAFGPLGPNPPNSNPPAAPAQPPADAAHGETDKPRFDLGFDPSEKAELPFDLPGGSGAESDQTAAVPLPSPLTPPPSFPAPSFPPPALPATSFPAPSFPPPALPATSFPPPSPTPP